MRINVFLARIVLLGIAVSFQQTIFSQDIQYARKIIDTLSSPSMNGRGYVKNGDNVAAGFINNEFTKDSLKSFGKNYFQSFQLPVGTLPGKVDVMLDKQKLIPGVDYLVSPGSPSTKGTFSIVRIDSITVADGKSFDKILKSDQSQNFVLLDSRGITDKKTLAIFQAIESVNYAKAKGVIVINDKLIWGQEDALTLNTACVVTIKRSSLPALVKKISVNIEQDFQAAHHFKNIIGYIQGKSKPDSFFVFSAHYDHLGRMGSDIYFPGANDNASGTALMLNLAKYYSQNKPDYSIVFIAFCGEELGLIGSQYYTEHPLFPLKNIRFLINLDLEGTGDEGIKVVNGTIWQKEFAILSKINEENKFLPSVNKRGEAAISDHYPFHVKKVKTFYIYTLGGISEYHNIFDKPETLPLTKYPELFKLITDFVKEINQ